VRSPVIHNTIYVSRSVMQTRDVDALSDLHIVSTSRNAALNLTGFLVATNDYFAQYLEGEQAALDEVMKSIRVDPRHAEIREGIVEQSDERRFPFWRMAFFSPTSFASVQAEPIVRWYHQRQSAEVGQSLVRFMLSSFTTVTGSYLII
jgi:hypothetical protein